MFPKALEQYADIRRTIQTDETYGLIWKKYRESFADLMQVERSLPSKQAAVVEQYIDAAFDVHMHMLYLALKETEK